jgi:hypothetical protein
VFCANKICDPSGITTIEIDGNSCDAIGNSDPTVIITFPTLPGWSYVEEHIWVGSSSASIPSNPEGFPYTTRGGYCTSNVSPAICTIRLKAFLASGGLPSCTDDAVQYVLCPYYIPAFHYASSDDIHFLCHVVPGAKLLYLLLLLLLLLAI